MMRAARRAGIALLLLIVLALGWYVVAANYDYSALAGTYSRDMAGERCVLQLRPDETFTQMVVRGGQTRTVQGRWRRYGMAHVSFSSEFIPLTGEDLNPLGEAHGQFDKMLGLFPSLTLAPLPGGPSLRRSFFH